MNAASSFSVVKQPCWKLYPVVVEKMLIFKLLAKTSVEKTLKEIAKTTEFGLRAQSQMIIFIKKSYHLWTRKVVRKKPMNYSDWSSPVEKL